jgi:hypothetical protein
MLTELGYQVETHTISKQPRKTKYPANSPHFLLFIFYLLKKYNMERKHHMHGKIKPDDANTEKQSLDLLFLSSPTSTCKVLLRETGGTTNWFLDCIVSTQIYKEKVQAIKPDALGLGTKS